MTDLPIALEWAKAVGAPLAALIAASAAIFGFRYQRRLDRRLDWYAAILGALGALAEAAERVARKPNDDLAEEAANTALDAASALATEGFMYVGSRGWRALRDWSHATNGIVRLPIAETAVQVRDATATAMTELIHEARASLGAEKLSGRIEARPLPIRTGTAGDGT